MIKRLLISVLLFTSNIALAPTPASAFIDECHPTNRDAISFSASGDNTVIAADANRSIYVWQFFFVNNDTSTTTSITLKEGSTAKSGAYKIAALGSHSEGCTGTPWAVAPPGSAFIMNSSAAVQISGTVYYTYSR